MSRLFLCVGLYLCLLAPLSSHEIRPLYQKNAPLPLSSYEQTLVAHVRLSVENAYKLQSKLTGKLFEEVAASKVWRKSFLPHYHPLSGMTKYAGYHLLNNLCDLPGASHLHMGLLAGDSLIAALYGNEALLKQQVGVDWFKECPEVIFSANCEKFLKCDKLQVMSSTCFEVDRTCFTHPIDIYFYDADHSLRAHENAFVYFNPIFADVFIAVIDDWSAPWVRGATFKAFDKLGYCILYERTLLNPGVTDGGQYVAVIRRPSHASEGAEGAKNFSHHLAFTQLKNQIFKKVREGWCSEEKANLIMELVAQVQPKVCVEVGAFIGSSFLPCVATLHFLGQGKAYAIDAWSNREAIKGVPSNDPHYAWWSSVDMAVVYQSFLQTMVDPALAPYYETIYASSRDAAPVLDQIDFLHLDGNFSEEGSLDDVLLYLPKVVPGGYILLSNLYFPLNKQFPKIKALGVLLEQCDVVAEVDNNNTVLFQKN